MSAWRVHAYGRGELRLEPARVPALRTPADVLVRVRAASLNPLDVAMMGTRPRYFCLTMPTLSRHAFLYHHSQLR